VESFCDTVVGFSALFGLLDASTAKRSELLFGLWAGVIKAHWITIATLSIILVKY
jgi:hypothetical protein